MAANDQATVAEELGPDSQLNIWNFASMRAEPPRAFEHLRFDPNNDCNVHCVYCHNHRSRDLIDVEDLRTFIEHNVVKVNNFQFGCIMEPTLDRRLADIMLLVGQSKAKPANEFLLQTNGILLFKHDYAKMQDAGLNCVSVSLDSANPETLKALRGGTSLNKVAKSVEGFRKACPSIPVVFISTVTSTNVEDMESLVTFGLNLGVKKFILRAIFYHPDSEVVDHTKMPDLLLKEGDYPRMKERLLARFKGQAEFDFADATTLATKVEKMKADSFR